MAVSYQIYPKDTTKGRSFGFIVIKSSKVVVGVLAPLITFLPGIGGKGNGTQAELEALYSGEVPGQLKEGIEKYGFVCVAIQSNSSYSMGEPKFALEWAMANLPIDNSRTYLTGLSWGGGGTAGFAISSAANAKMYDAIAPIAMTWQNGTPQYAVDANIAIWAFHNLKDTNAGTPVAATNAYIDSINKLNPKIAASKTLFETYPNHGGWGEAYSPTTIPIAAGSQGLIDPACNLYEWFLMNNSTTRVVVPRKGVITPPIEPIPPTTTLIANAGADFETVTPTFKLKGSTGSTGYLVGENAEWSVEGWPDGVNKYKPILDGAGYIDVTGKFETPGKYVFKLVVKDGKGNVSQPDRVTVTYNPSGVPIPTPKVPKTFDWATKTLNFEDGTKETVTSAKFITSNGTIYEL